MQRVPLAEHQQDRVAASLPFVESLARRMASTMPHSIDLGDLVQDGVLGLIDAAHRFDEDRGIKFETFAERRVRGAMIDALRRDAWPRGVRRVRRELEAAREELRRELGAEPIARRPGAARRRRRVAPRADDRPHQHDRIDLAARQLRHDGQLDAAGRARAERAAVARSVSTNSARSRDRVRTALAQLPARERRIHEPLLLRRSDDEADWARDWRQRIARVAASRARDSAAERKCSRPVSTPPAPKLVAKTEASARAIVAAAAKRPTAAQAA